MQSREAHRWFAAEFMFRKNLWAKDERERRRTDGGGSGRGHIDSPQSETSLGPPQQISASSLIEMTAFFSSFKSV